MKTLKYFIYFCAGSVLLCGFSTLQKSLSGFPLTIDGFIIPIAFGGFVGVVVGHLFMHLQEKNKLLKHSNEEYWAANEELTHKYNELRDVYKELQVTKHKAQESERLKSSFLSNLSHEIRTPLNGIVGFVQILDDESVSADERKTYIDNVMESTDRLLEVVNNTVEIAKIESGSVELRTEKIMLYDLMKPLYTCYKEVAQNKGLDFELVYDIQPSRSVVFCDCEKLTIILRHLLHNALKFTTEGKVSLGARLKDAYIEFYVEDSGIGIDTETQELIFNRFSQGEGVLTTDVTGTGLGLTISKAYVELMGGMLELESEPGKGSRFFFIIPYDRASD